MNNSPKSEQPPQEKEIYKIDEYAVFLGLIEQGLWKNNRFLAEVVGVNEDTIADWKKREEVKILRQKSIAEDLKKWKKTSDPEKRLKEQGMDFDAEKLDVSMQVVVKGLESLE